MTYILYIFTYYRDDYSIISLKDSLSYILTFNPQVNPDDNQAIQQCSPYCKAKQF